MRVTQGGDFYLAKGWRLGESVVQTIDLALGHGLTAMLQNGHPQASKRGFQGDGAVYMSFARTPAEYWVMAINDKSPSNTKDRSDVGTVLINKTYRHVLEEAGIPHEVETFRNASNIAVALEHADAALIACVPFAPLHGRRKGRRSVEGTYPGFRDEADIERWLMENLERPGESFLGRPIRIVGRQIPVGVGIVDILLSDQRTGGLIALEVKQGRAQPCDVDEQLMRYLNSAQLRTRGNGMPVLGCLVAEKVEHSVRTAVAHCGAPITAFEIKWLGSGSVSMNRVAGAWPDE